MYRDYEDRAPDGDRILREIRWEQRREEMQKRRRREIKRIKMIFFAIVLLVVFIAAAVIFINLRGEKDYDNGANYNKTDYIEKDYDEAAAGDVQNVTETAADTDINTDINENINTTIPETDIKTDEADGYSAKTAEELKFTDNGAGYMGSEEVTSTYSILTCVDNRTVEAVKNAYDKIYPASMTKILTLLVACENIDNIDDTFEITIEDTDYAYSNDCSAVGFSLGEVVKVKDLLYGTILPSGGDAAHALARYVAGSHEAFVDMMNERLVSLGISDNTHFTNCVGIYDDNHYTTCYSMAVIMEAAMDNPLAREVLSAHRYTTTATAEHPEGIDISNFFLRRIEDKDTIGEVIGAKTGFVVQSRNCAASYYTGNDGISYICVTGDAHSAWRAIYDHVAVYNIYAAGNTGYKK